MKIPKSSLGIFSWFKKIGFYWCILFSLIQLSCSEKAVVEYPIIENEKIDVTEFGITYTNEFSNLENIENPVVSNWFKRQDSLAENYFQNPEYEVLLNRHTELENRESHPAGRLKFNESGLTFFRDAVSKENSELLYYRNDDSTDNLIFDSSTYKDGEYEISFYEPSYNGEFVAVAMGKPEMFFDEIIILDVASKKQLGKTLTNAKPNKAGAIVWSTDNNCILYILYPNSGDDVNDRNSYTVQYCIDNLNADPKPIYKNGLNEINLNPEFYPVPGIRSEQSNYLFIYEGNAADHWDCYYLPIEDYKKGVFNWKHLFSPEDKVLYSYGTELNHKYYFKRVHDGNTELCFVDLKRPDFKNPEIVFRGNGSLQVSDFKVTKSKVYFGLSSDGISEELYSYDPLTKKTEEILLPFSPGDIGFDYRSPYLDDIWVTLYGWTSNPKTFYLNSDKSFDFLELGMWPDYPEFSEIISEVVEVTSHDGTKVPLSIVRRKDHAFDGSAKGIITAYGAYGFPESPWFHSPIAAFVNQGNIYATAHVRGGGEKGPKWHEEGKMEKKPNSWKDLIACSEYLIQNNLVKKDMLSLNVNSAGAIAGGMAVNERPDLYRVFTGFIPNLNLLRTEYIEELDDTDILYEFGTIKNKESFKNLLAMDPVTNLKTKTEYPSSLMIIGFKDYLISPSAAGKYIAFLQENSNSPDRLHLIDIKYDAEHEIDWVDDYSRVLYFTIQQMEN
ncbi:prolyl oligopeptidase family serine peptidase [Muriicola sp. SD30]|uniref:prolyl oligopeptidase family serine peptidase n=1 Tax=Muriicola sp. SD30 TaxID=3240936 RepID=UPI00350FA2C1